MKGMVEPLEGFRVPDKEVPSRLKVMIKFPYQPLLGLPVKVDHRIPAKNQIEIVFNRVFLIHQIDPFEGDHILKVRLDLDRPFILTGAF